MGLKFKEFTQAMFGNKGKNNGALDWLLAFRLKKVTFGKYGDIKKKLIGMRTSAGKAGFKVEFNERSRACINTRFVKRKDFTWNSSRVKRG